LPFIKSAKLIQPASLFIIFFFYPALLVPEANYETFFMGRQQIILDIFLHVK